MSGKKDTSGRKQEEQIVKNVVAALLREKTANFSLPELSALTGIPTSSLGDIIAGKTTKISIYVIYKVCKAIRYPVSDFFYGIERKIADSELSPEERAAKKELSKFKIDEQERAMAIAQMMKIGGADFE